MKNVEAVFVGSGPNAVRRFIAPYWEDMIVSEMTNSHIAESCTIPPHGNGVMLNAKVRDEEVMRFVHEILHTFGASLTEKDQGSTDHTYRLVSIGISKVDSVGTQSSGMPETSSHIKSPDSLGADSAKSECCSGGQLYPEDSCIHWIQRLSARTGITRYPKSVRNESTLLESALSANLRH